MNENIHVNDGKGLYDNQGLIDSIIADYNALPRLLIENQFIKAAGVYASVGQRLGNLKNGIKADTESFKAKIEDLKALNDSLLKGGGDNGTI